MITFFLISICQSSELLTLKEQNERLRVVIKQMSEDMHIISAQRGPVTDRKVIICLNVYVRRKIAKETFDCENPGPSASYGRNT